jgi:hypothetical protein
MVDTFDALMRQDVLRARLKIAARGMNMKLEDIINPP